MRRIALLTLVTAFLMASVIPVGAAGHAGNIAIQFEWQSSKPYAGQFHDFVQFTADPPPPSGISGTVLGYESFDSTETMPLEGATVVVWTTDDPPAVVTATETEADGTYTVEVGAGEYYVQFEAEGYHPQFYNMVDELSEATQVQVAAFTFTDSIDALLDAVEVPEETVDRIKGDDRYKTAAALTASVWETGTTDVVVLASGTMFPDALTASGLAGAYMAPVLITLPTTVPPAILAEIARLTDGVEGAKVFIVGGPVAVAPAVETQLTAAGYEVERVFGDDRYETSAAAAEHIAEYLEEGFYPGAFIARGDVFADALALSPFAWSGAWPVLLVSPNLPLPVSIEAVIEDLGIDDAVIAGGNIAVSAAVEAKLEDMVTFVERVEGVDRYETAAEFAEWGSVELGHTYDFLGVASGTNFPDALAGGPVVGANNGAMVLTTPNVLAPKTAAFLQANKDDIGLVRIFGGNVAISAAVETAIAAIVDPPITVSVADAHPLTGTWNRLPGPIRVNEDRLHFMLEDPANPVESFNNVGCYVACHDNLRSMPNATDDTTTHYALASESTATAGAFALDMWHWRGGRGGPMGYAEDTWVAFGNYGPNPSGRMRDAAFAAPDTQTPTNWTRTGGDRFREDMVFGGALNWEGTALPRFVFNPAKASFNNYFLANPATGEAFTSHLDVLDTIDSAQYVSQIVAYQDYSFDADDKVNSIDIQWLLFKAGEIADPGYRGDWDTFWSAQLPGVVTQQNAIDMLDAIVASMEDGVLVTRTVGFIYQSSQHDISSKRAFAFDPVAGTWTVTMYRDLNTGQADDVSLEAMLSGGVYNLGFAMHDLGKDRLSHHISFPYTLAAEPIINGVGAAANGADISAEMVPDVWAVDWSTVGEFDTSVYQAGNASLQALRQFGLHQTFLGGWEAGTNRCQTCHTPSGLQTLIETRGYIAPENVVGTLPVTVRAVYSVDLAPLSD